jgi:hypothetical protein
MGVSFRAVYMRMSSLPASSPHSRLDVTLSS